MCADGKAPTRGVRGIALVAAWVGFTFVVKLPVAFSQALDCNAQFYPGHVLVRFKPTTTAGAQQAAHTAAGALQVLTEYHAVQRLQLVEVLAGQEQAAIAAYQNDSGVEYAEPDYLLHLDQVIPNYPDFTKAWGLHNAAQTIRDCSPAGCGCQACVPGADCPGCPDEALCKGCPDPGLWDADIDAPQAWEFWTGDPNFRIAVIDTGVKYDHPDLYRNIWINQDEIPASVRPNLQDVDGDGLITFLDLNDPVNQGQGKITDLNGNGYIDGGDLLMPYRSDGWGGWADGDNGGHDPVDDIVGFDFAIFTDNDPMEVEEDNHGTPIAGIIAADGNNGIGATGVNWRAKIVPLKIFPTGPCGPVSSEVKAVQYCIDNKIRVSTNSYGSPFCVSQYNVIAAARNNGHIFVASAGNTGADNDTSPHYPSNYRRENTIGGIVYPALENVIAVAATDNDDDLAYFAYTDRTSNWGKTSVDLAAPGLHVWSTWRSSSTPYGYIDGTSAAAPFVAGVAALVWSQFPDWDEPVLWLKVKNRILSNVRKVNALRLTGPTPVATEGVVNAYRALVWDCNGNGIDDGDDIAQGRSSDCMGQETECCLPKVGPGCQDAPEVESCVCGVIPACCDVAGFGWTTDCLNKAINSCRLRCLPSGDGNTIPDECDPHGVDPVASDAGVVRRNRALRFTFPAPVGGPSLGMRAIQVRPVDLQHPDPVNLPAKPPPNYTAFDLLPNGTCADGAYKDHHCHIGAGDCKRCAGGSNAGAKCSSTSDCPGSFCPQGVCSGDPPRRPCTIAGQTTQCNGGTCVPASFSCNVTEGCTAAGESNECARWVGKPGTFLEDQEVPTGASYRAARLQCTPFYHDWGSEEDVHVVGAEIVPSSIYEVVVFAESCMGNESMCADVSCALEFTTARSGDVQAPFNPPSTTSQPDAIDVAQVVAKVKNLPGAPVKAIAQLQTNLVELNANVSALDIVVVVDAVKGFAYAFSGPCPCPSTVTCGSTACSNSTPCVTLFGAGSLCVKTCIGGANAGYPCINDTHEHCPGGGVCGNGGMTPGFCRDRCGRCN